jgi:hypothetical protein
MEPGTARLSQVGLVAGIIEPGHRSPSAEAVVSALLWLKSAGILDEYPNLATDVARGEVWPSYWRAFDAQLAAYTGNLRLAD